MKELKKATKYAAKNLYKLRESHGLTQQALARMIGFSANSISLWENRRAGMSLEAAIALADFFGVSLDYLAGRDMA